jgi:transposase
LYHEDILQEIFMNTRQVENKDQLLDQITKELDKSEASQYYARLAYVRLALAGLPVEELSRLSGKSKPAINLWIRLFLESGEEALKLHQGKHPKLSASQMEQIRYDLTHAPADFGYSKSSWTGPLLSEHIRRMHKEFLHPRQCQRMLLEFRENIE